GDPLAVVQDEAVHVLEGETDGLRLLLLLPLREELLDLAGADAGRREDVPLGEGLDREDPLADVERAGPAVSQRRAEDGEDRPVRLGRAPRLRIRLPLEGIDQDRPGEADLRGQGPREGEPGAEPRDPEGGDSRLDDQRGEAVREEGHPELVLPWL